MVELELNPTDYLRLKKAANAEGKNIHKYLRDYVKSLPF